MTWWQVIPTEATITHLIADEMMRLEELQVELRWRRCVSRWMNKPAVQDPRNHLLCKHQKNYYQKCEECAEYWRRFVAYHNSLGIRWVGTRYPIPKFK